MRTKTIFCYQKRAKKPSFFFSCGIFLITRGRLFHTLGAWLNSAVVGRAAKKAWNHARRSFDGDFLCLFFFTRICQNPFLRRPAFFFVQRHVFFYCRCCCNMPAGLKDCLPNLTHHEKFQKVHTRCSAAGHRIRDEQKSPPKSHDGGKMICGSQIHTDCKEHL